MFDDMVADIMANKKFQTITKELFIRCRKLYISLVLITQSYFSVLNNVRLNSAQYSSFNTKSLTDAQENSILF